MPVVQINISMYLIYKTVNNINNKFYIGKQANSRIDYYGSGILLNKALKKYGKHNFTKHILESNLTRNEAADRERYWIQTLHATSKGYNIALGGEGGSDRFKGRMKWWNSLTKEKQKAQQRRQGMSRSKGWYVSKVNGTKETYIQNIAEWCDKHGVDKSMPTRLNNNKDHCFQKQTKGWRIRRADMSKLPAYENRRHIATDNGCKGKSWRLVQGKRVWYSK
jgi:group I intron endonuclease